MTKNIIFTERRGRKKAADPIRPVTFYVHHSIICNDENIEIDSEAYKIKLDEMKRKLTEHVYSTMIEKSHPYSMK